MTQDSDAIHRAIARQSKWHHAIEVAPGIWTPGLQDTATVLRQINLPEDLSGKRVLDIGARDGFFSFEAERRGASEVIAVDYEPPHHTGFSIAAELLDSKVQFINANVYSLSPERFGTFDIVLFLGVIYHLRHPLLALDRIHDVTNPEGQVFVETHMLDQGFVHLDGSFHQLDSISPHLRAFPIAQYFPGDYLAKDPTSQWAPNQVALNGWLQGSGFTPTYEWQEGLRGGATGVRFELEANSERAIDEAERFNMDTWTVETAGQAPTAS